MEEKCCWGHVYSFQQRDKLQQIPAGCYSLPLICSEKEELHTALSFNRMADSKRKKELIPLPLIKDDKVITWLNSDPYLAMVVNNIPNDIDKSVESFDTELIQIQMIEAYEDHSYEEIEINVKVSKDMDIYKLNELWDQIGANLDKIIEDKGFDEATTKRIKQRLLIVVSQE